MSNKNNNMYLTKKSKSKLRTGKKRRIVITRDTVMIIRELGLICPPSVIIELGFPDTTVIRTGGASPSANWSYNANNAYDPDPSFGSGAMPGFTEWSTFYERYRVHAFTINGTINTLDAIAVGITVVPMPVLFGNNTRTVGQIQEYGANPLALCRTIAGNSGGSSIGHFTKRWTMTEVLGNSSWLMDPNYTAFISGSPATQYYLFVGAYNTNTGVNWTNGLGTNLRIGMTVEFYTRRNFTT